MHDPVNWEINGDVALIGIDNPPVNALSHPVRGGLMRAIASAVDSSCKALVLFCHGRTFVVGADIREFDREPAPPHLPEVVAALEAFNGPVVAALHGSVLGGGLELAMGCHYRIASDDCELGLPEVKLGLIPGAGGTQRLPRLVGISKAVEMMISGEAVSAGEAQAAGLVDRVLPAAEPLREAAMNAARELIGSRTRPRPTGQRRCAPLDNRELQALAARIERRQRGQIAPGFILELAQLAAEPAREDAFRREREHFLTCRASQQCRAMRHVFRAERATMKVPEFEQTASTRPVRRVGVVGAGTMGAGIALSFARAALPVQLLEASEEALAAGIERLTGRLGSSVRSQRISADDAAGILARVHGSTDPGCLHDVDLVVEAVFEDPGIKQGVFRRLGEVCREDCVLASNTSYLDIDELARVVANPSRVIGAHFFSPADVMQLLEVVRGSTTDPAVVRTTMQLARTLGKIPVAVANRHGFVGNRMLRGYTRQANLLLLEGASPGAVDQTMESWGMAMGPFAVADLAGLDIGYRSRRNQGIEAHSRAEFAIADHLVESGRLGRKTGSGYYRYDPDSGKRTPDPEVDTRAAALARQHDVHRRPIGDEEVIERLTLVLLNEGAKILREGVARCASDIDVVYVNGYGFPRWRGGPMFHAEQLGLSHCIERLRDYHRRTADACWEPAELLLEKAGAGAPLD